MTPSRTPEGPLNFCPVCGQHCRMEPSVMSLDAVCPHCGSLLWFDSARQKGMRGSYERVRQNVNRLAEEIAQLPKMNLKPTQFYGEFLQRLLMCLAAPAGAIWSKSAKHSLVLQYQMNIHKVALDLEGVNGKKHDGLLEQAILVAKPGLFLPKSSEPTTAATTAGNPTDYVILLAPIVIDDQAAGLIEIWQDPNRGADAQRGFLQFLMKMAGFASDYLRNAVAG
jgi:hypothetical protein